ncbi:MAG: PIG-L deacetylase family protein [Actinomycetota bacterium]
MRLPRTLVRTIARAKPLVPERAWPVLLSLRSLAGSGPIVGLPSFRRVLALAAHPDDESIGCGGTLALLADRGAVVSVVFATDGEATRGAGVAEEEVRGLRRAEAQAACRALGLPAPRFLGHPDGDLASALGGLSRHLQALIDELAPEAIMAPWVLDPHPDHVELDRALAACTLPDTCEVWMYETWAPLAPNRVVDITGVMERKRSAVAEHATAHLAFDVGAMLGLSRYRSVHGLMGRGYAEAFMAVPAGEFPKLLEQAAGS